MSEQFGPIEKCSVCGKSRLELTQRIAELEAQACRIAEDEIERRGLRARYTFQLLDSLNYTASMDGFWLILTATPAQRCKAMLAAVREC